MASEPSPAVASNPIHKIGHDMLRYAMAYSVIHISIDIHILSEEMGKWD